MTHGSTMFNPFLVVILSKFGQTNDTTMALANSSAMGTWRAWRAPPGYEPERCPQQLSPQQNGELFRSLQIDILTYIDNNNVSWGHNGDTIGISHVSLKRYAAQSELHVRSCAPKFGCLVHFRGQKEGDGGFP